MEDVVNDPSYDIKDFCRLERMSKSKLYEDWEAGRGPRYYWNGKTRRISHEARVEWRRRREAEAAAQQATLAGDEENA
jgi:hypothetical protein